MCAKLFEAGVDVFRIDLGHVRREKLAMLRGPEAGSARSASSPIAGDHDPGDDGAKSEVDGSAPLKG